jgi:ATP-dependent Lon protease
MTLAQTVSVSEPRAQAITVALPKNESAPVLRRSFATATRSVPVVLVQTMALAQKAQSVNMLNGGVATMVEVAVQFLPSGDGPQITTDSAFATSAKEALTDAVYAAAQAVRYDVRYLRVHVSVADTTGLGGRLQINGASATVAWSVAVASVILGDAVRPDVCMSGTLGANLEVGPVAGLVEKVGGCHSLRSRELIVPVGHITADLSGKAMQYSMQVTEAGTLADAYGMATGQRLRSFN